MKDQPQPAITTGALPASSKVYITGTLHDIRVPMRRIELSGGEPALTVYDTSGPYTDPQADNDIACG